MKLSALALREIDQDNSVKNLLAAELGKSEVTIRRWLKSNSPMLTTESALRVIEKETGLPRRKILTDK